MERFRIEVGLKHDAKARNIVGAIANEAGLESRYIGNLDIQEDYSLVDLPKGMPYEVFQDLKKTWVCDQQLNITRLERVKKKNSGSKSKKRKNVNKGAPRRKKRDR